VITNTTTCRNAAYPLGRDNRRTSNWWWVCQGFCRYDAPASFWPVDAADRGFVLKARRSRRRAPIGDQYRRHRRHSCGPGRLDWNWGAESERSKTL